MNDMHTFSVSPEKLPTRVTVVEVGPRDGFQFESTILSTDLKVDVIRQLVDAGCMHIQAAAFVHPEKVPQMADAGRLFSRLADMADVQFSALVLNDTGVRRAGACGVGSVEISISASDTHGRKNAGMPLNTARAAIGGMVSIARDHGMVVIGSIQCAFGCVYEGPISPDVVMTITDDFLTAGVDTLSLADTTGMGTPVDLGRLLARVVARAEPVPVGVHLHDTRGLGLVNAMAALGAGVCRFDTSIGGMGGCPFVEGAAGNISTEDTANLFHSLGIGTGLDIDRIAAVSRQMESVFGHRFSGKYHHL